MRVEPWLLRDHLGGGGGRGGDHRHGARGGSAVAAVAAAAVGLEADAAHAEADGHLDLVHALDYRLLQLCTKNVKTQVFR